MKPLFKSELTGVIVALIGGMILRQLIGWG
jgi:hypothetical protein